jgi:dihydroflavonol-4-reductase
VVERALVGCDGDVHTAALVDLRRAMADAVESTNTRGVEVVVGGAARRGLPSIVYVSSLAVFFTPGGPPLAPDRPIAPGTTAYARAKARSEVYVRGLQDGGAQVRISYPAGIMGPDDPGPSLVNAGLASYVQRAVLITSAGFQVVDVRDVASLHVKLLELPTGAHRYAASSQLLPWRDLHRLLCQLTGRRIPRAVVPGALLRATGHVVDVVARVHDFDFPMTRDAMEFTTRWPGADASSTTRELGLRFRDVADTYRDTLVWMYRTGHLGAADVGQLAEQEVTP